MKAKLDKEGHLFIDRRGVLKQQDCRFTTSWYRAKKGYQAGKMAPVGVPCTDHCPLMGEPVEQSDGTVLLQLCHGRTLVLTELEDLREAGEPTPKLSPLPNAKLLPVE